MRLDLSENDVSNSWTFWAKFLASTVYKRHMAQHLPQRSCELKRKPENHEFWSQHTGSWHYLQIKWDSSHGLVCIYFYIIDYYRFCTNLFRDSLDASIPIMDGWEFQRGFLASWWKITSRFCLPSTAGKESLPLWAAIVDLANKHSCGFQLPWNTSTECYEQDITGLSKIAENLEFEIIVVVIVIIMIIIDSGMGFVSFPVQCSLLVRLRASLHCKGWYVWYSGLFYSIRYIQYRIFIQTSAVQ